MNQNSFRVLIVFGLRSVGSDTLRFLTYVGFVGDFVLFFAEFSVRNNEGTLFFFFGSMLVDRFLE